MTETIASFSWLYSKERIGLRHISDLLLQIRTIKSEFQNFSGKTFSVIELSDEARKKCPRGENAAFECLIGSLGSGLGKTESGIKDAIKVELKMDKAGMGYDASEKFTYQWWDHVYNAAAKSIETVKTENGVSIKRTSDVDVCTKRKNKSMKNKPLSYGNFVKTATLTDGLKEVKDTDYESDSSCSSTKSDNGVISKMTDEQLFRACDGMTGHKGARHGINMTAKLLRIQQHDEQFMLRHKTRNNLELNGNSLVHLAKHSEALEAKPTSSTPEKTQTDHVNGESITKQKRKKRKCTENEVIKTSNENFNESATDEPVKRKKMKRSKAEDNSDKELTNKINRCEEKCILKVKKRDKKAAEEIKVDKSVIKAFKSNSEQQKSSMKATPEKADSCETNFTSKDVSSGMCEKSDVTLRKKQDKKHKKSKDSKT